MEEARQELNRFLVEAFHTVLRAEERYLRQMGFGDLSISEMHVIEACLQSARDEVPGAAPIAARLGITPGSLSIAVAALEGKGYLKRERDPRDRRRILIHVTAKGMKAEAVHRRIHDRMVDAVLSGLSREQAEALLPALQLISQFFADVRN